MSRGQKIVTIALWTILVVVMLGVISAGAWDRLHDPNRTRAARADGAGSVTDPAQTTTDAGGSGQTLPVLFDAPGFSLIDQDQRTITDRDLRGHPYIAAFIYTQCAGPCPMITGKMAALQRKIHNPAVRLVSFSVDPEHDTPAVLKAYAARFGAEPGRWLFLSGKPADLYAVAAGMKMTVQRQPEDQVNPVLHSTYLLLVDGGGHVRAVYGTQGQSVVESELLDRVARDADAVAAEISPTSRRQ
jgi:protein SCO1/2